MKYEEDNLQDVTEPKKKKSLKKLVGEKNQAKKPIKIVLKKEKNSQNGK